MLSLLLALTLAKAPILPWQPKLARGAPATADVWDVTVPLTAPAVSSNLCSDYASELTGNWWCLRGDGTMQAGSVVSLAASGSPTANTLASVTGTDVTTRWMGATADYYGNASVAGGSGDFSVGWWGAIDSNAAQAYWVSNADASTNWALGSNTLGRVNWTYLAGATIQAASGAITTRAMHFLVGTYRRVGAGTSEAVLYVDGVQVAQTTTGGLAGTTARPVRVGAPHTLTGQASNTALAFYTDKRLTVDAVRRMARSLGYGIPRTSDGWDGFFTRASTGTFVTPSGRLGMAPPGQARLVDGRGYLNEPAATNLALGSDSLETARWTRGASGGLTYTGTADYGFGPDGSKTATRLQLDAVDAAGEFSRAVQSSDLTVTAATNYTFSFWARATTGTANLISYIYNSTGGHTAIGTTALTTSWQRVARTFSVASGNVRPVIGNDFNQTATPSVAADVLVTGVQIELGPTATSNILTDTATATRNVDALTFSQRLTQQLPNTEAMVANWGATALTSTADTADTLAPDGTQTATKHVATGATSVHSTTGSTVVNLVAGRTYRFSTYLKAGTGRYIDLARTGYYGRLVVDLQTGTTVAGGDANAGNAARFAAYNITVEDAGNGWYRVGWAAGVEAVSDTMVISLWTSATPPAAGVAPSFAQAGETFYSWGANLVSRSAVVTDQQDSYVRAPAVTASGGSPDLAYGVVRVRRFPRNWALQSEAFGTAPWTPTVSGGATLTVANNTADVADPLGGAKASKLAFSAVTGTQTAFLTQAVTGPNTSSIYRMSVWLRTDTGSATIYAICTATNAQWRSLPVTSTWQRFDWLQSRAADMSIILGIKAGTSGMGTLAAPVNIYAFGMQMMDGAAPVVASTPYAPTTTAVSDTFALRGKVRMEAGYAQNTIGGGVTFAHVALGTQGPSDALLASSGAPPTDPFTTVGTQNGVAGAPSRTGLTAYTSRFALFELRHDWRLGTAYVLGDGASSTVETDYTNAGQLTVDYLTIGNRDNAVAPWSGYLRNVQLRAVPP